ncbi:MAG TPA: hypothetical protein VH165_36335 [Kofleriaceae bacterium]|nr:hypothetical protein [Kofleriaceae bacterium]
MSGFAVPGSIARAAGSLVGLRALATLGALATLATLGALAGCFPTYQPGSFPVAAEPLGCLDVAVLATRRPEAAGPVAVVYLGNRCDHRVAIDLTRLTVVGGSDDGAQVAMIAFDPDREIAPRRLDALGVGEEWIEYHPVVATTAPVSAAPSDITAPVAWLDVDVGRIATDEPPGVRWIRAAVSP